MRTVNRVVLAASIVGIVVFSLIGTQQQKNSHAAAVYTVPISIDHTCGTDVTQAINNWIAAVPDDSLVKFQPEGCYKLDRTIQLNARRGLILDGQNATFRAGTDGRELPPREARTRAQFLIYKSTGITLKNMTIYGANKNGGTGDAAYVEALEAQHAVDIQSGQNVVIDNVDAFEVYGDFVYIGSQGGYLSDNVVVKNGHYEKNGRQGMSITGGKNVVIEHNYMDQTRRSTFDIEPNTGSGTVENIMVRDNEFGPNERLLFFANGGACARNANVTFQNNVLNGRPFEVTSTIPAGCAIKRGPYYFIGNTSNFGDGNPGLGLMVFAGIDGLTVKSNNIAVQAGRGMRLVRITGNSNNVQVSGNRIPNASRSLLINDPATVTNYCFSDNMIGNPLTAENSTQPCQTAPPPAPSDPNPPTDNPPPPADTDKEIEADLGDATPDPAPVLLDIKPASGSATPRPDGAPTATSNQTGSSGSGSATPGSSGTVATTPEKKDGSSVSAPKSMGSKVFGAITDIPSTLNEAVTNPTSIPDMLESAEKKAAFTAFAGLTALVSGGLESGHLLKSRRRRAMDFFKHHNLAAAGRPLNNDTPNTQTPAAPSKNPGQPGAVIHPDLKDQDTKQ